MTSSDASIVQRRVLVDFDGDGFFNSGVSPSAPPNLFPNPLFTDSSFLRGFNAAFTQSYFTDVPEVSARGFVKRSIRLGDQAITIRLLMNDYQPYQPRIADPVNLLSGYPSRALFPSSGFAQLAGNASGTTVPSYLSPKSPVDVDNGLIGYNMGRIAYDTGKGACLWALGYRNGISDTYVNVGESGVIYTNAVNTAVTFLGIPVTANTAYTLIFYTFLPHSSYDSALGGQITLRSRYYSNDPFWGTGSPFYGRFYIGGNTNAAHGIGSWVQNVFQFTTSAAATRFVIDLQMVSAVAGALKGDMYIGGMMLLPGTVAAPARFWDNTIGWNKEQFSVILPGDSNQYNLTYHVRSPNGITKLVPTRNVSLIGTNTTTSTVLSDINVTSDWQRIDMNIPASASERGVWLTYTAEKGGSVVSAGNAGDVEFSGFMLTQGADTNHPFHAGQMYGHEDITPYVISTQTRNGKKEFNSAVPDEGTATFHLRNDSKRFSPNNKLSPLYGFLDSNLKAKIQIKDAGGNWIDIWSGWTEFFDVTPGTTHDLQAIITARQGLFRLADGALSVPLLRETTADILARAIIESSGWRSAANVLQSFIGIHTLLGVNSFTTDTSQLYGLIQQGINRLELTGKDWSNRTDPRQALEDVLGAENAMMWIGRDGRINIVNRNHWITDVVDKELVLDTAANRAEYQYGQDLVNAVEITVTPNKAIDANPVWETKRPVFVNPNQVWTVLINPQFTEGRNKTVLTFDSNAITKTVYTKDVGINNDVTGASASAAQSDAVVVELLGEAGNRPQIRLTNNNGIPVWVKLSVTGKHVDTGDSILVRVEDQTSIEELQARHLLTYSNTFLDREDYARSYGEFIVARQGFPQGEFISFSIVVRNATDLANVLAITIGSRLLLSEVQSAETKIYHTVIGEDFDLTDNQTLTVTYTCARTFQEKYAKADITIARDETVNYLPNLLNAVAGGGGGVATVEPGQKYGVENIIRWKTEGIGTLLYLATAREQVRIFEPLSALTLHPQTDNGGFVFNPIGVHSSTADKSVLPFSVLWRVPPSNDHIFWYTQGTARKIMTAAGTPLGIFGGVRSKTTDEVVGAAAKYFPLIPVTPLASYRAYAVCLLGNINQLPGGSQQTGQRIEAIDRNGAVLMAPGGGGSPAVTPTVIQMTGLYPGLNHEGMADMTYIFQAKNSANEGVGLLTFKTYSKANVFEPEGLMRLELARITDNRFHGGAALDPAVTKYMTAFVQLAAGSHSPADMTLSVGTDDDYSTISLSSTVSVNTSSIAKIQVGLTAAHVGAVPILTVNNARGLDVEVIVLAYGITTTAINSISELLVKEPVEVIYT